MSATRSRTSHKKSALKSYRRRVKFSRCRGMSVEKCRQKSRCKTAKGHKRSFCRKKRNTKRNM